MIPIIYEDKDIIAVNKPAGMVVHPDITHKNGTLIQEIIKLRLEIKGVGDLPAGRQVSQLRPGIVHRLDKDTSGVLIIAKNQSAFECLKSQFKDRKIIKKYIALVEGEIKNNSGVINLPIGKNRKDFRKKLAAQKTDGKSREATTEYNVRHRVSNKDDKYTLVEVFPKTGRTHQIRAHFKAIGHPIVCDSLYGGRNMKCPFGLKRQYLHANFLEFNLPSGARVKLEADMPKDLENVLEVLRKNK